MRLRGRDPTHRRGRLSDTGRSQAEKWVGGGLWEGGGGGEEEERVV